ncbi:MAG: TIR domain-containing protein [Verrucomicrobia bacterium]|nr:TIR domain-containing protein [Verrucomicrobiota bacterium]
MSVPSVSPDSRAVFLSYAHEDTDAAQRVASALRAGGLEVWFDRDELRGGDAWDTKIKRQIQSCTLFLPLISAHTNRRGEGYFRREWNLAVNRTLDMAQDRAFLLPVVIDATAENAARVPDKFLEFQWSRLPAGETPAAFVELVRKLLADPTGHPFVRPPPPAPRARRSPRWGLGALAAALAALLVYVALRPFVRDPAAAPLPADKSIAVLPFANRSPDQENALFADGVHDDVQTILCNIRELRIVSRTSVEQYRGTKKRVKQIAGELGVSYVLTGSVQRVGPKVRVTGQLVDARTDAEVWANNYLRDLTDIFAIQTELATEIAGKLQAVLSPQEKKLLARAPTTKVAALDLFHKAIALVERQVTNDVDAFARAAPLLQSAVELDPEFAPAWGRLAVLLLRQEAKRRDPTGERVPAAQRAIDTMERLAPDSLESLMLLATYYSRRLDFARAEGYVRRATEAGPNNGEVIMLLGDAEQRHGRFAEALAHYRRAYAFDRQSFAIRKALREWLVRLRRYDETARLVSDDPQAEALSLARLAFLQRGSTAEMKAWLAARPVIIAGETMDWWWTAGEAREFVNLCAEARLKGGANALSVSDETRMAFALMVTGETEKARAEATRQVEIARTTGGLDSRLLAVNLALLGDKAAALAALERYLATARAKNNNLDLTTQPTGRAVVLVWAGEKDQALAELARLLRAPSGVNVHEMRREPYWHPLRGDPRFEALLSDPANNAPLF